MTTQEFSAEFDILYNNIASNQGPGIDEYEKGVFLTNAQDDIILSYFNPKKNKFQDGFDGSAERQYDFSTLIRTTSLFNINSVKERITDLEKIDRRSQVFVFPQDYFLSINEVISDGSRLYSVIPLEYTEYQRLMLKPYALPVKKAAWRLFSDKKNCNAVQEYIPGTQCDYKILTTWADQKRNLEVTLIVGVWDPSYAKEETTIEGNSILFKSNELGDCKVTADASWSDDKKTYEIDLTVFTNGDTDDESVFKIIAKGFQLYKEIAPEGDSKLAKAMEHLDAFIQAEAPSKFSSIRGAGSTGKVFKTELMELPIAEIIGKFYGPITYQLRYIKKPTPIVLVDLEEEGLSIRGVNKVTECALAPELHREILQRAVELAKAAYIGDVSTNIALGTASGTDKGVLGSSK